MTGKRYSEEEVVRILREVDGGKSIAAVCRECGVSEQTVYRWRNKYQGLAESDVQRLRELTDENVRLKRIVADQALDNAVLKELLSKKW